MAINLAAKFEPKVSNILKQGRKTKDITNQNWDWDGVNAINVYTLTDVTMGNYDPTAASNRYGTPSEVQDTVQNWALSRDRSWTKVMDKKNIQDTGSVRKPGAYLAQQTKNIFIPEMDTYILSTIQAAAVAGNRSTTPTTAGAFSAATGVTSGVTTSSNAYTNLLAMNANVTDSEAPEAGRIALMTAQYYNLLKQSGFIVNSDIAMTTRQSGDLGEVDGLKVVIVTTLRMPTNVDLVIAHPNATVAPEKLIDYTLHENAPGYSGSLLEYRHRYDAFVDSNLVKEIATHMTA